MRGEKIIMMLMPRTQRLGIRVDGNSPDLFSQADAAAATTGVPYGALVALQMIYGGMKDTPDRAGWKWAQEYLTKCASESHRARKLWRLKGAKAAKVFPRLIESAWYELVSPELCPSCLGRGHHVRGDLLVQCRKCLGEGSGAPMDRHLRTIAGVSLYEWKSRWRFVQKEMVAELANELNRQLAKIRKRAR